MVPGLALLLCEEQGWEQVIQVKTRPSRSHK